MLQCVCASEYIPSLLYIGDIGDSCHTFFPIKQSMYTLIIWIFKYCNICWLTKFGKDKDTTMFILDVTTMCLYKRKHRWAHQIHILKTLTDFFLTYIYVFAYIKQHQNEILSHLTQSI